MFMFKIINIGSIAGLEGYPGGSIYCASKFAVQGITESLRKELVATKLRVTAICPGNYILQGVTIDRTRWKY